MEGIVGNFFLFLMIYFQPSLTQYSRDSREDLLLSPKFSTKTGYDLSFTRNNILKRNLTWRELFNQTLDTDDLLQDCSPVGLYVVYRHGSRYPSKNDIVAFNSFVEKVKTSNINPAFKHLQDEHEMSVDLQRMLSKSGRTEINHLAGRLKKRFPELFPVDLRLNDYELQSTNLSRTIDSALAFIHGLVGTDATCSSSQTANELLVSCEGISMPKEAVTVPLRNQTSDDLLRFFDAYEQCLTEHNDEEDLFMAGKDVGLMQQKLAKKLSPPGASTMFNLTRDESILLVKMCGFQLALFNRSSLRPLLSPEDLSVFEYKQDLQHYWNTGYGQRVNYLVSCKLMQDMIDYFDQLTKEQPAKSTPKGIFKFAHAETIIPLQCLLNLYDDKRILLASGYRENWNRQFRTSRMAPFSANVALVLFNCSSNKCDSNTGEACPQEPQHTQPMQGYKLQVLVNELPVDLPFCQKGFCDLEEFTLHIKQTIGRCDFNNTCCLENCYVDRCHKVWLAFGITLVVIMLLRVFCSSC